MLEIFKAVLTMSLIGSILTISLILLTPITEKLFSGKWHYSAQKIVVLCFIIPIITILNFNLGSISNEKDYLIDKANTSESNRNEIVINNIQETIDSSMEKDNLNKESDSTKVDLDQSNYVDLNPTKSISISFINKIISVWIIGMIIFSLWYVFCYLKIKHDFKKDIIPVQEDSDIYTIFEGCKERVGIKRKVDIYLKSDIRTPLVIGFFKNIVLVPDDIAKYENINDILCHELTHVKRRDLLIKLIMTLASIVHWFNPLIYILRNNLDMYCELSCDENITMYMSYEDRKKYGESVIRVAENFIGVRKFGNAFGGNKNYMKRRLIMILKSKKQRKIVGAASVAVIGGVLLGGGYASKAIYNKVEKDVEVTSAYEGADEEINSAVVSNEDTNNNNTIAEDANKPLVEEVKEEKSEPNNTNTTNNDKEIRVENTTNKKVENDTNKNQQKQVSQPQQAQQAQQTATSSIKYRNEKLGIELTLPSYWKDKFKVVDTNEGIAILYIFQSDYSIDYDGNRVPRGNNKTRLLASIEDVSLLDENTMGMIDTIANVPRFKNIHGKKYVIGGPTDCLEMNDPDRPACDQFKKDLPDIINSMTEV